VSRHSTPQEGLAGSPGFRLGGNFRCLALRWQSSAVTEGAEPATSVECLEEAR
jgi:hypothetical protein